METSVFIAKIFGLCYLIIGISFILNRKILQQVIEEFSKSVAALFYGGIVALVVGIVIILTHNVWVANWRVIITIIGWLGLIKGIWITVFPDSAAKLMKLYQGNERLLTFQAVFVLVFGITLTYFGFFAG